MEYADINDTCPVVLVTDASSLLGTNIVECFLGKGYKARGLPAHARVIADIYLRNEVIKFHNI